MTSTPKREIGDARMSKKAVVGEGRFAKARVIIEGVKPLLLNAFSIDAIPLERQVKTGVAGNDPEEWKKSVTFTEDRQLYLDPTYIFGCLRNAGKNTKEGKQTLQSKIASTLQVLNHRILLNRYLPEESSITRDPLQPVYLDVRPVRNPNSRAGSRNIRYRVAASPGWTAEFEILWDATIVNPNVIEAVLNDAGSLVGLGDGRSIGFGRFIVKGCDVQLCKGI